MGNGIFSQRWYRALMLIYGGSLVLLLCHHEPWRDEMQAWLLARDSATLGELWHNTRYEGHPLLWHLVLWVISRWTHNPSAMQIAHGVVSLATAGVFLAFAPFPRWVRVLWLFSYFPLFEYGVISRNYGVTILFLFLAVVWRQRPFARAAALGLAAHASPMGVLLVPVLALLLITKAKKSPVLLLVLALAWGAAAFTCLPPADYEHARGVFWQWDALRGYYVLRGIATAFLPIFRPELHFWNNSFLFPFPPREPFAALSFAALVVCTLVAPAVLSVRAERRALFFYLSGLGILITFFYLKFPGATRHHGFAWVWTVLFLWLSGEARGLSNHFRHCFFILTLGSGLAGTLLAARFDLHWPFSAGKAAAQAVSRYCGLRLIVGHPDWAASTVAGYLPEGSVFYLTTFSPGSFVVWNLDRARRENLSDEALLASATTLNACLLVNRPLLQSEPCSLLTQFPQAVVMDEQFWLYRCWSGDP